jgi:hypothetical protein
LGYFGFAKLFQTGSGLFFGDHSQQLPRAASAATLSMRHEPVSGFAAVKILKDTPCLVPL